MKICVIGAGIVGLAVARDLMLRGIECVVVERGGIGRETTAHCGGLLHSGARYVMNWPELAHRCAIANEEIRRCAPFVVGTSSGLFVCLENDADGYAEEFEDMCRYEGVPVQAISRAEALEYQPALNPSVTRAFMTRDTTIDPFLLLEAHFEELNAQGMEIWTNQKFVQASPLPGGWNLQIEDVERRTTRSLSVDGVVNAAGPWASDVAHAFGVHLPLVYIHGSMIVLGERFVSAVVTHCAPTSIGDVLVPNENSCLGGSTWRIVSLPEIDGIQMPELQAALRTMRTIVPRISIHHVLHSYSSIRAHPVQSDDQSAGDFGINRTFTVINHAEVDAVHGLVTALAGKLSFYRIVAELASNALLRSFDLSRPCRTEELPLNLPRYPSGRLLSTSTSKKGGAVSAT